MDVGEGRTAVGAEGAVGCRFGVVDLRATLGVFEV